VYSLKLLTLDKNHVIMSVAGSYANRSATHASPPPIYHQVQAPFEGGEMVVKLKSDYGAKLRDLRKVDPDSVFPRGAYVVPESFSRFYGTDEVKTGETQKTLTGPIKHVTLNIGYMPEFPNPDGAFLGGHDNLAAMQTIADCFTSDLNVAVRAAIDKYNGAMADIADEGGIHRHIIIKVKDTQTNLPQATTWQATQAAMKVTGDAQNAVAHAKAYGCPSAFTNHHRGRCGLTIKAPDQTPMVGSYAETEAEDNTPPPKPSYGMVPGKGTVRPRKRGSNSSNDM
jgi:hypothetical protein